MEAVSQYFNPRSPWGERPEQIAKAQERAEFQSTLPVGGATSGSPAPAGHLGISIHAPRGGSDIGPSVVTAPRRIFQSTLPVGGATSPVHKGEMLSHDFNPRSPWGERPKSLDYTSGANPFQSTLPVGGATDRRWEIAPPAGFQSTLPVGGATLRPLKANRQRRISIHAPRGGSDFTYPLS